MFVCVIDEFQQTLITFRTKGSFPWVGMLCSALVILFLGLGKMTMCLKFRTGGGNI